MDDIEPLTKRRASLPGCLVLLVCIAVLTGLVIFVLVSVVRSSGQESHCGKIQSQLVGALYAYSTEQPSDGWAKLDSRMGATFSGGTRGRLVTTKWFETVAANFSLPNIIFRCPASNSLMPSVKPQPSNPASVWGMESGRYIGYALDWAAPIEASSNRPILADRDPDAHRNVISAALGRSAVMVAFGDAHVKKVPVTWNAERTTEVQVTEGMDSGPISAETALAPDDDIYSTTGDSGDPLTPGKGDSLRAWVK